MFKILQCTLTPTVTRYVDYSPKNQPFACFYFTMLGSLLHFRLRGERRGADPFAAKLGLIVHHHKPESCVKRLDCCVHGHSDGSKLNCMFVSPIFFCTCDIFATKLGVLMYCYQ